MLISVVTPTFNSGALLEQTAASILSQDRSVDIEYLVFDGGSTDGSIEQLRESTRGYTNVNIVSESDRGMYDALAKGFRVVSGDVVTYLNAGDLWTPWCASVVTQVLASFPDVAWMTGYDAFYSESGAMIGTRWPARYTRYLIQRGAYGSTLPAIQQESTFWRRELLADLDLDRLAHFKLAGDAYLWHQFSQSSDLHLVRAVLSGFRFHGHHLSDDKELYRKEAAGLRVPPGVRGRFRAQSERLAWKLPDRLKLSLPNAHVIRYDRASSSWLRRATTTTSRVPRSRGDGV